MFKAADLPERKAKLEEFKKGKPRSKAETGKDLVKRECTASDTALIREHYEKMKSSPTPLKFKGRANRHGGVNIRPEYNDPFLFYATLGKVTGTPHTALGRVLLDQTISACCVNKQQVVDISNAVSAAMLDIAPRDVLEGMLASQIVATYNQAMECLRRANIAGQPVEIATGYHNQAIKLMRAFTTQIEAFKRYRTGGQQKVIVEHVHVNQGGQAIVVTGGGGDEKK
jgi:hypothetical protein